MGSIRSRQSSGPFKTSGTEMWPALECSVALDRRDFVDFHDWGGLCSPGRWPPKRRSQADSDSWTWLRNRLLEKAATRAGCMDKLEREVFSVAGGEAGCRLVTDQQFIDELVDIMEGPSFKLRMIPIEISFSRRGPLYPRPSWPRMGGWLPRAP